MDDKEKWLYCSTLIPKLALRKIFSERFCLNVKITHENSNATCHHDFSYSGNVK